MNRKKYLQKHDPFEPLSKEEKSVSAIWDLLDECFTEEELKYTFHPKPRAKLQLFRVVDVASD